MAQDIDAQLKAMTEFFGSGLAYDFVAAAAKLNAHYYLELIRAGVDREAAAVMAAQYKNPGM